MSWDALNFAYRALTLIICMKTCSACGVSKDEDQFYKQLNRLQSHCKACAAAAAKLRRPSPEVLKAKNKAYYEANKAKVRATIAAWVKRNPEKHKKALKAGQKRYRAKPAIKAKMNARMKQWRLQQDKGKLAERDKAHRAKHGVAIRARERLSRQRRSPEQRQMARDRRRRWRIANELKNPVAKVVKNLRRRVHYALGGQDKSANTMKLIGCTPDVLRQHLEALFKPGMSWCNYAIDGWHVDHVRPCAAFDLSSPEQQRACFHYTNLQPLWWHENTSKGDRV
jgi:hypothetical protein